MPPEQSKPLKYFVLVLIAIILIGGYFFSTQNPSSEDASKLIVTFEGCAQAGNPIMESFPEQCRTKDGVHFVNWRATDQMCAQVITPAKNPSTGEIREFPTPCDVPSNWEKINTQDEEIDNSTGTLAGKVTIGPNCPVEQAGNPCETPPEAYAAREFLVFNSTKKQVASFHPDANGNFSLTLPPGTYTVTSAKGGMGFMSKNLPQTVTIQSGQTTTLHIDVDTGIR